MDVETRLKELGIILPQTSKPLASYVPGLRAGNLIYISGQLPIKDSKLIYSGKLGRELQVEEGQAAARLATINCMAALKSCLGQWHNLKQIVKITGYIQSTSEFYDHALVLNGSSNLLVSIFGDKGKHTRAAVGVVSLPLNAACEIEMIAEIA